MTKELKLAVPYAVIGSNTTISVNGKKVRGRQYPWGIVDIENPNHCDFIKLRTMLITFMQDLKEVTQDFHYENYRAQRMSTPTGSPIGERKSTKRTNIATGGADGSEPSIKIQDKDEMLKQKEQELQRMQEMIAKMQAQMQLSNTNL